MAKYTMEFERSRGDLVKAKGIPSACKLRITRLLVDQYEGEFFYCVGVDAVISPAWMPAASLEDWTEQHGG